MSDEHGSANDQIQKMTADDIWSQLTDPFKSVCPACEDLSGLSRTASCTSCGWMPPEVRA